MRTALSAILIVAAALANLGTALADEVEVLSGDAFRVGKSEYRIANIDAPKLDGRCQAERQIARNAQAKLAEFLSQGDLEIVPTGGRDDNGRTMATVKMNGEDVGEKMLGAKLAQRHGSARPLCPSDSTRDRSMM